MCTRFAAAVTRIVIGIVGENSQFLGAVVSTQPARTSSVHTLKFVSVLGPNVVLIATSEASRTRA